jgi:hypothetical protein
MAEVAQELKEADLFAQIFPAAISRRPLSSLATSRICTNSFLQRSPPCEYTQRALRLGAAIPWPLVTCSFTKIDARSVIVGPNGRGVSPAIGCQ